MEATFVSVGEALAVMQALDLAPDASPEATDMLAVCSSDGQLAVFAAGARVVVFDLASARRATVLHSTRRGAPDRVLALTTFKLADALTLVLYGTASGVLAIALPTGELLVRQRFHCDALRAIRLLGSEPGACAELVLLYGSALVSIDGAGLAALRGAAGRLAKRGDVARIALAIRRRWALPDGTSAAVDVCPCGTFVRPYESLDLQRELPGRDAPLSYYLLVASAPAFALIAAGAPSGDGLTGGAGSGARPVMRAAVAQISTAVSAVFGWFASRPASDANTGSELPDQGPSAVADEQGAGAGAGAGAGSDSDDGQNAWEDGAGQARGRSSRLPASETRVAFVDESRRARTLAIAPPPHTLAALGDSLGRVLVVDTQRGAVVRCLKGYRDAQCAWLVSESDADASSSACMLLLAIWAPRRGVLELWRARHGARMAALSLAHMGPLHLLQQSGCFGAPRVQPAAYLWVRASGAVLRLGARIRNADALLSFNARERKSAAAALALLQGACGRADVGALPAPNDAATQRELLELIEHIRAPTYVLRLVADLVRSAHPPRLVLVLLARMAALHQGALSVGAVSDSGGRGRGRGGAGGDAGGDAGGGGGDGDTSSYAGGATVSHFMIAPPADPSSVGAHLAGRRQGALAYCLASGLVSVSELVDDPTTDASPPAADELAVSIARACIARALDGLNDDGGAVFDALDVFWAAAPETVTPLLADWLACFGVSSTTVVAVSASPESAATAAMTGATVAMGVAAAAAAATPTSAEPATASEIHYAPILSLRAADPSTETSKPPALGSAIDTEWRASAETHWADDESIGGNSARFGPLPRIPLSSTLVEMAAERTRSARPGLGGDAVAATRARPALSTVALARAPLALGLRLLDRLHKHGGGSVVVAVVARVLGSLGGRPDWWAILCAWWLGQPARGLVTALADCASPLLGNLVTALPALVPNSEAACALARELAATPMVLHGALLAVLVRATRVDHGALPVALERQLLTLAHVWRVLDRSSASASELALVLGVPELVAQLSLAFASELARPGGLSIIASGAVANPNLEAVVAVAQLTHSMSASVLAALESAPGSSDGGGASATVGPATESGGRRMAALLAAAGQVADTRWLGVERAVALGRAWSRGGALSIECCVALSAHLARAPDATAVLVGVLRVWADSLAPRLGALFELLDASGRQPTDRIARAVLGMPAIDLEPLCAAAIQLLATGLAATDALADGAPSGALARARAASSDSGAGAGVPASRVTLECDAEWAAVLGTRERVADLRSWLALFVLLLRVLRLAIAAKADGFRPSALVAPVLRPQLFRRETLALGRAGANASAGSDELAARERFVVATLRADAVEASDLALELGVDADTTRRHRVVQLYEDGRDEDAAELAIEIVDRGAAARALLRVAKERVSARVRANVALRPAFAAAGVALPELLSHEREPRASGARAPSDASTLALLGLVASFATGALAGEAARLLDGARSAFSR